MDLLGVGGGARDGVTFAQAAQIRSAAMGRNSSWVEIARRWLLIALFTLFCFHQVEPLYERNSLSKL